MASFGCDQVLGRKKGTILPTHFDMTSGQQEFLKGLAGVAESLVPENNPGARRRRERTCLDFAGVTEAFRQAIVGPWLYKESEHSLGWDSDQERLHALRAKEPSSDKRNRCVIAALWLAFQALPLFPAMPGIRGLEVVGFKRKGRSVGLRWPIWNPPIGPDSLRSLLALGELWKDTPDFDTLKRRRVSAVFQSQKSVDEYGYGIFRPAVAIA